MCIRDSKYQRAHAHINTRKSTTPVPEESVDQFEIPDTEDLQNIDDYDWNNTAWLEHEAEYGQWRRVTGCQLRAFLANV